MRLPLYVMSALWQATKALFGVAPAILLLVALVPTAIAAEGTATQLPQAQVAGQCPNSDPLDQVMVERLRELSFTPGVIIDPSTFMQDPNIAKFVGEMTKRAQLQKQMDWSGLCRYRADNKAQLSKGALNVVFLGDSITENWLFADPTMFAEDVIDRGISGQTTSQILLRFYPDVVALRPKVVHILAGTNDILQNTGPVGDDDIINNINAMIDIAQVNHIKVVLASVLPISVRPWQPDLQPAQRLIRLNERLKALAATRKVLFIDYFAALKDANDGLSADLGNDGVHPNRAGYAVMKPLATQAIEQALQ